MTARLCRCGHSEAVHELYRPRGKPAERRTCRTGTAAGPCTCRRFTPAQDGDDQ